MLPVAIGEDVAVKAPILEPPGDNAISKKFSKLGVAETVPVLEIVEEIVVDIPAITGVGLKDGLLAVSSTT